MDNIDNSMDSKGSKYPEDFYNAPTSEGIDEADSLAVVIKQVVEIFIRTHPDITVAVACSIIISDAQRGKLISTACGGVTGKGDAHSILSIINIQDKAIIEMLQGVVKKNAIIKRKIKDSEDSWLNDNDPLFLPDEG